MAFTNTLRVTLGAATKKSDIDNVATNAEWLQTLAAVDHDFDITTGTGKHKTIQFLADNTYNVGSAAARAATVFLNTLGDSGKALSVLAAGMFTAKGAVVETNLATVRAEYFNWMLGVGQSLALGDNFYAYDATTGTGTAASGGYHTTAAVAATKAATSAGDSAANRIFLDTDSNTIRAKKTSGAAVTTNSFGVWSVYQTNVDLSSVKSISIVTIPADANFSGSPSSIQITLYNSSVTAIDPFSLTSSNGDYYQIGVIGINQY